MNLYPNLYALLESNSRARSLFDQAPPPVRRQLMIRQHQIHSIGALNTALAAYASHGETD